MRSLVLLGLISLSCSHTPAPSAGNSPGATSARAKIEARSGSTVSGEIVLTAREGAVQVEGELHGLPANSRHGFHVHVNGDCSAADASSAGGHFNPQQASHGAPHDAASHIGDLGNIEADGEGVAHVSVLKVGATLGVGDTNLVGKSVIVHQDADDFTTQPTGNAGGRIGCGVIGL